MAFDYINEAFKKLELLTEDTFDTSSYGVSRLSDVASITDDSIRVIDADAEEEEDLLDSYVGKVIVNCNICHSNIFKNKSDIVIDEEGCVNPEDVCPYCGEQEGYVIVGEIAPYVAESDESQENVEVTVDGEEVDLDTEEDLDESVLGTIGLGLLGGAAVGAGSSLTKKLMGENTDKETLDESVLGAIGLGLLGGAAAGVGNSLTKKLMGEDTEDTDNETLEEDLDESVLGTIGLGLLGGAAVGVGSSLTKKVMGEDTDKEDIEEGLLIGDVDLGVNVNGNSVGFLGGRTTKNDSTEVKNEGLIGDVNVGVDVSDNSVGFLGGTAKKSDSSSTTNNTKDIQENKSLRASRATRRAMKEDFKDVSITTDDQHMEMSADENGKVTVTTEPVSEPSADAEEEMITPVSQETQDDILMNNDVEEPVEVEDDLEFDFDEIDEEGLDELGESYFHKVYENVNSFKTTNVSANSTSLIVEGIITFDSGAKKKTGFIFDSQFATDNGRLRFNGRNKQLTEATDAFYLTGRVDNKKLFVESLKYNYNINDVFVRGIVRRK